MSINSDEQNQAKAYAFKTI